MYLKNPKPNVPGRPTKNSSNEDSALASSSHANEDDLLEIENKTSDNYKEKIEDPNENDHRDPKEPTAMELLRGFISDEESDIEVPELEPHTEVPELFKLNKEPEKNVLKRQHHEHSYSACNEQEKQKRKVKICH